MKGRSPAQKMGGKERKGIDSTLRSEKAKAIFFFIQAVQEKTASRRSQLVTPDLEVM